MVDGNEMNGAQDDGQSLTASSGEAGGMNTDKSLTAQATLAVSEVQAAVARYCYESMVDFDGAKLNFVQIGLGTNATFSQNLAGTKKEYSWAVEWLMEPFSEYHHHQWIR